jgi:diguanylate cyclase (GGDEF)-like protein
MFFDLLIDPKDESKALAIYNRFLKNLSSNQPPERIARYAFLQQKQNRPEEASEQYGKAAELFSLAGREEDALFCLERMAQLEPENLSRQVTLAEVAERNGRHNLAARALLRAGQLATAATGSPDESLKYLARAHALAPQERSVALLYGAAKLRKGDAADAAKLLEPFALTETDPVFLETFSEALMRSGQLDRARELLEKLMRDKNAGLGRLFQLAEAYTVARAGSKAVEVLANVKRKMFADKRQNEFAAQLDDVAGRHPESSDLLEFWAALYNELNRESKYFEIMIHLFDAYLKDGNVKKACDSLERLVDIDSYDYRNQERLERLRGKADGAYLQRLASRLTRSGTSISTSETEPQAGPRSVPETGGPVTAEGRRMQALEDLIVQTEIFLQYSLQNKALDRLHKIAELFPGEENKNTRLQNLYQAANFWPQGVPAKKSEPPARPSSPPPAEVAKASPIKTGAYNSDTLRDLSKISEINQKIFRQQTPRAMLNTAVNEIGEYLRVSRALAVIGTPGRPPDLAAEYCGPNMKPAPGAQVVFLLAQVEKAEGDELGGLVVEQTPGSVLGDLGLRTALGAKITDRETQQTAGMLIVGHTEPRKWKPNETYFLQAIGDQMLMSVSHTRLRSLVRRMGVSDERTGLLSRSSYQSCLLTEADRARTQGTPLALTILQIDRGGELLRQQGESPVERFLEQLARALQPIVRQNDVAVKYTSWSLAFILPDTTLEGAQNLAEKLRRAASGIRPPWDTTAITLSAGIVEAVAKSDFDSEDIVTDLMNRAETSVDEARKRGGDTVVTLEAPKL